MGGGAQSPASGGGGEVWRSGCTAYRGRSSAPAQEAVTNTAKSAIGASEVVVVMGRTYLPHTEEAVRILGLEIAAARRQQRWTAKELSERVGVTEKTLSKIERRDPSVGIGIFFEAAVIVGVLLFGVEAAELRGIMEQRQDRLAVLPAYVRGAGELDVGF